MGDVSQGLKLYLLSKWLKFQKLGLFQKQSEGDVSVNMWLIYTVIWRN